MFDAFPSPVSITLPTLTSSRQMSPFTPTLHLECGVDCGRSEITHVRLGNKMSTAPLREAGKIQSTVRLSRGWVRYAFHGRCYAWCLYVT